MMRHEEEDQAMKHTARDRRNRSRGQKIKKKLRQLAKQKKKQKKQRAAG
jgi:hypothetical protein